MSEGLGSREPAVGSRARPAVAAAGLALGCALAVACSPPAPDLLLLNARIFTADPARPWAEALAIRGERIVAVGSDAEVSALATDRTARRDLGGRTVIPGLNDAHVADAQEDGPGIAARAQSAAGSGVTSMQWFAGGRPVRETVSALLAAGAPQRVRVFRMPRPGPDGETIDSRPHLPPQPSVRLDVRGMGFVLAGPDGARIRQAVSWAYGTEDLLALEPADADALRLYVEAVEHTGLAEVWNRKRPRVEQPGGQSAALGPRLAAVGMVAVCRPDGNQPLASLVRAGVPLALATGGTVDPFAAVAWAVSPARGAEALTIDQALMAFTRGSAYAESADREKGHLSIGALADMAVLTADPFTAAPGSVGAIRSRLTIIGGRVVHDVR